LTEPTGAVGFVPKHFFAAARAAIDSMVNIVAFDADGNRVNHSQIFMRPDGSCDVD